jgi:hypothetical protein
VRDARPNWTACRSSRRKSEEVTVAVKPDDIEEGDEAAPNSTPSLLLYGGSALSMMLTFPNARY